MKEATNQRTATMKEGMYGKVKNISGIAREG